jgi:hypothetical protein
MSTRTVSGADPFVSNAVRGGAGSGASVGPAARNEQFSAGRPAPCRCYAESRCSVRLRGFVYSGISAAPHPRRPPSRSVPHGQKQTSPAARSEDASLTNPLPTKGWARTAPRENRSARAWNRIGHDSPHRSGTRRTSNGARPQCAPAARKAAPHCCIHRRAETTRDRRRSCSA